MKAIETRYKGCRFRSRLEARWAVFFDALGIKWQYEPEGFDLGSGVWYLPDFYLPEFNVMVEIKPDREHDDGKAEAFAWALAESEDPAYGGIVVCYGVPQESVTFLAPIPGDDIDLFQDGLWFVRDTRDGEASLVARDEAVYRRFPGTRRVYNLVTWPGTEWWSGQPFLPGLILPDHEAFRARGARFERGETP